MSGLKKNRNGWPVEKESCGSKKKIQRNSPMKNLHFALAASLLSLAVSTSSQAGVTRIVIDETIPLTEQAGSADPAIAYEVIAGRAFGELDPKLPRNAIIQDIE